MRQKRNGASPRERARTIYMRANRQFLYIKQPDVIRRSQFSTEAAGLPPFSQDEPQAWALSRDEEQAVHGLQVPDE